MVTVAEKKDIADYVGFEPEPTHWFTVTQDQINQFADCTLDHQYIHIDPAKAKDSPFGSTIAHGFLSLSMLSHFSESYSVLIDGAYMGINYGFDKVRFIAPVKVNSRIRAVPRIIDITEKKPGHYQFRTEVIVEIEGSEKPAMTVDWLTVQMVA